MSAFPGQFGIFPGRRRAPVYAGSAPYAGDSPAIAAMSPRAPSATPNYPPAPFIDPSGASRPTIGSMPMSPYGGNSSYADSHSAPWMASLERSRQQQDQERLTAGNFAASKRMGQNDAQARGSAYIAGHGGPFLPGPYGQTMQAPPTIVAPTFSGSRGAAGAGAPLVAPYGANVVGGNTAAMGQKAFNPVDHSTIVKNLTGRPITNLKGEITGYNGLSPQDAEAQAQKDMAGGPAAATTQPSQPQYPTTPQNDPSVSEFPSNTKGKIGVTTQQARAMVGAVRQSYPGISEADVAHIVRGRLTTDYGVPGDSVDRLFGKELEQGHIQSEVSQGQVNQGVRMPLSMLGASSGGGNPALTQQQAVPGPSIPTPASGQTTTGPVPGHTPMQLDEGTASKLLQQAGGNKDLARSLAKQQGFTF